MKKRFATACIAGILVSSSGVAGEKDAAQASDQAEAQSSQALQVVCTPIKRTRESWPEVNASRAHQEHQAHIQSQTTLNSQMGAPKMVTDQGQPAASQSATQQSCGLKVADESSEKKAETAEKPAATRKKGPR